MKNKNKNQTTRLLMQNKGDTASVLINAAGNGAPRSLPPCSPTLGRITGSVRPPPLSSTTRGDGYKNARTPRFPYHPPLRTYGNKKKNSQRRTQLLLVFMQSRKQAPLFAERRLFLRPERVPDFPTIHREHVYFSVPLLSLIFPFIQNQPTASPPAH